MNLQSEISLFKGAGTFPVDTFECTVSIKSDPGFLLSINNHEPNKMLYSLKYFFEILSDVQETKLCEETAKLLLRNQTHNYTRVLQLPEKVCAVSFSM